MAHRSGNRSPMRAPQQGVVLFIALIVLVAMTLAGIAITRSVDTANLIAGNVAFKQSSVSAADRGIQAAVKYLQERAVSGGLSFNDRSNGYFSSNASHADWTESDIWDDAVVVPDAAGKTTDAAGNTVAYLIHRLCATPNADSGPNCAESKGSVGEANSNRSDFTEYKAKRSRFYRISVRVQGPKETLSIVQANVQIK